MKPKSMDPLIATSGMVLKSPLNSRRARFTSTMLRANVIRRCERTGPLSALAIISLYTIKPMPNMIAIQIGRDTIGSSPKYRLR